MFEVCDLCGNAALELLYKPQEATRTVFLCTNCGLLQSLPRGDRASGSERRASDTTKSLRAEANLSLIEKYADLDAPCHVIDVGAHRGAFSDLILRASPRTRVTAFEQDMRLADHYKNRPRLSLSTETPEDVSCPDESVDLIYTCHTLHQLSSPRRALTNHWRKLKPSGHLFLEVPSLESLRDPGIVEEWFVDENAFHFSAATLLILLNRTGFMLIEGPDPGSRLLTVIARKTSVGGAPVAAAADAVEAAATLVAAYQSMREKNLRRGNCQLAAPDQSTSAATL